jgi:hypothetical protein
VRDDAFERAVSVGQSRDDGLVVEDGAGATSGAAVPEGVVGHGAVAAIQQRADQVGEAGGA